MVLKSIQDEQVAEMLIGFIWLRIAPSAPPITQEVEMDLILAARKISCP
jgi:hypothetical protein